MGCLSETPYVLFSTMLAYQHEFDRLALRF
jgi:hypothetical protein